MEAMALPHRVYEKLQIWVTKVLFWEFCLLELQGWITNQTKQATAPGGPKKPMFTACRLVGCWRICPTEV